MITDTFKTFFGVIGKITMVWVVVKWSLVAGLAIGDGLTP